MSIAASTGESLAFSNDGALPTRQQWTGPVSGAVTWSYDTSLRLLSENGVTYGYDVDGLVTTIGALTLTRDDASGFLTGTGIGILSDADSYNVFGELSRYSFRENGGVAFDEQYVQDKEVSQVFPERRSRCSRSCYKRSGRERLLERRRDDTGGQHNLV